MGGAFGRLCGGPSATALMSSYEAKQGYGTSSGGADVATAALHIQEAMHGRPSVHPRGTKGARTAHLLASGVMFWPTRVCTVCLLLLAFFETPDWCVNNQYALNHTELYPVSGLPKLTKWPAAGIEVALLLVLIVDLTLVGFAQGPRRYLLEPLQAFYAFVLCCAVADFLVSIITPASWFRLGMYLRLLLFVCRSVSVQQNLDVIRRTLPSLTGVGATAAIFLAFCSWASYNLTHGTKEGDAHFPDLTEAAWELFILMTTSNFPDIMMQAYDENRIACTFFIAFLVIGNLFLLNVVIAIVYKAYNDASKAAIERREAFLAESLTRAFSLLDAEGRGCLRREEMNAVFRELSLISPELGSLPEARQQYIYASLDLDGDGQVDAEEFGAMCATLRTHFQRGAQKTWFARLCPAVEASRCFAATSRVVRSPYFDWAIDGVLLVNFVLMLVRTAAETTEQQARPRLGPRPAPRLAPCSNVCSLPPLSLPCPASLLAPSFPAGDVASEGLAPT